MPRMTPPAQAKALAILNTCNARRTVTIENWGAAQAKAESNPAALTDDDIAKITCFYPKWGGEALEARERALAPAPAAPTQKPPAPAPIRKRSKPVVVLPYVPRPLNGKPTKAAYEAAIARLLDSPEALSTGDLDLLAACNPRAFDHAVAAIEDIAKGVPPIEDVVAAYPDQRAPVSMVGTLYAELVASTHRLMTRILRLEGAFSDAPAPGPLGASSDLDARLSAIERSITDMLAYRKHHESIQGDFVNIFESRLRALEARPALEYVGVHEIGRTYNPGAAVTKGGSLWVCKQRTTTIPGAIDGQRSWQLAVKRGRDGRDAKDAL